LTFWRHKKIMKYGTNFKTTSSLFKTAKLIDRVKHEKPYESARAGLNRFFGPAHDTVPLER